MYKYVFPQIEHSKISAIHLLVHVIWIKMIIRC